MCEWERETETDREKYLEIRLVGARVHVRVCLCIPRCPVLTE